MTQFVAFVLLALVQAAPDAAEAEKKARALFEEMELKVAKASSVAISSDILAQDPQGEAKLAARLLMTSSGQLRFEMKGTLADNTVDLTVVSDGRNSQITGGEEAIEQPTPAKYNEKMSGLFTKAGLFATFFVTSYSEGCEEGEEGCDKDNEKGGGCEEDKGCESGAKKDEVKVSAFQLGALELLNGREAQAIRYKLTGPGAAVKVKVVLWIDPETKLPVKRQIVDKNGDEETVITETYTIGFEKKIEPAEFELKK